MNTLRISQPRDEELSPAAKLDVPESSSLLKRRGLKKDLSPISDSSIVDEVLAKSRMSLSSFGRKKTKQEEIYSPLEMVKSKGKWSQRLRAKKNSQRGLDSEIMTPIETFSQVSISKPMTTDDIEDLDDLPVLGLSKHSSLQTYDRGKIADSRTVCPVIDELSDSSD